MDHKRFQRWQKIWMLWYLSPFNFIAKGRVVKSKLCLHRRGSIHFGAVLRILRMFGQLWFTKNVTFLWQFILWGGTQQRHPRREIIPCEPQDVFDTCEYPPQKMCPPHFCWSPAPQPPQPTQRLLISSTQKTRYVFQVRLDVQDRPRGNSLPQRLLNLRVQTTGDQTV